MVMKQQQSGAALAPIIAGLMAMCFVAALGFGIWAYLGMEQNQVEIDEQVTAATALAVEAAKSEKEAEFADREKDPFKNYTGSATYGYLSFDYPKSWSAYLVETTSGTILDFYAHPGVVAGITDTNNLYAYRAQILSTSYEIEAERLEQLAKTGKVTVRTYRPDSVPEALGIYATGEINGTKQGVMVVLPQRDKTIKFWTESPDFAGDFEKIIATLSFIP